MRRSLIGSKLAREPILAEDILFDLWMLRDLYWLEFAHTCFIACSYTLRSDSLKRTKTTLRNPLFDSRNSLTVSRATLLALSTG